MSFFTSTKPIFNSNTLKFYFSHINQNIMQKQDYSPNNPATYPTLLSRFPNNSQAGKSPPASRLYIVYRSQAVGLVRCLEVRARRRWWRVFGRAGRLKTRRGRGGGFAYTTARPQKRFAPSFLPNTSLGRKAGFRPLSHVWVCLVCIPRVSDGLFSCPLPPNPTRR